MGAFGFEKRKEEKQERMSPASWPDALSRALSLFRCGRRRAFCHKFFIDNTHTEIAFLSFPSRARVFPSFRGGDLFP